MANRRTQANLTNHRLGWIEWLSLDSKTTKTELRIAIRFATRYATLPKSRERYLGGGPLLVNPAQQTLANDLGTDVETIRRACKGMEQRGALTIKRTIGGRCSHNAYIIPHRSPAVRLKRAGDLRGRHSETPPVGPSKPPKNSKGESLLQGGQKSARQARAATKGGITSGALSRAALGGGLTRRYRAAATPEAVPSVSKPLWRLIVADKELAGLTDQIGALFDHGDLMKLHQSIALPEEAINLIEITLGLHGVVSYALRVLKKAACEDDAPLHIAEDIKKECEHLKGGLRSDAELISFLCKALRETIKDRRRNLRIRMQEEADS